MIYSYCKHCGVESCGDVCAQCGKRAPAPCQMDKWTVDSLPLADSRAWKTTLLSLLGAAALLLAAVFGLEAMFGGPARVTLLLNSSFIWVTLSFAAVGQAVAVLFLLIQGRETNVFTLDAQGAHQHTWHAPRKWKSWARLQSADPSKDIAQHDGTVMHLSQARHMLWQDVADVQYRPERSMILLYHTPRFAPMALKIPAGEYEEAERWVAKRCKGKPAGKRR